LVKVKKINMFLDDTIDAQLGFNKNKEIKLFFGTFKLRSLYKFQIINYIVALPLITITALSFVFTSRNKFVLFLSILFLLYMVVLIGFNIALIAKKDLWVDEETDKTVKKVKGIVGGTLGFYIFIWIFSLGYIFYYFATSDPINQIQQTLQ